MMNPKILMSINTAWNVCNFRAGLIRSLKDHGYDVVVAAPADDYVGRVMQMGCRFVKVPMDNNGTNPARDLRLLLHYLQVLHAERPQVYLGYTVKPNVYGSIAAHVLGIPVINNIAGLGTTFINRTPVTHMVRALYRFSLRRSRRVFFQNADDQDCFVREKIVPSKITDRLAGSGVDLAYFRPSPAPSLQGRPFRFLLVSRMLKDKGVEEFAEAARIVRHRLSGAKVDFQLLGSVDEKNPNAVPLACIHAWEGAGFVQYLGRTDDVRPVVSNADCVVLPSYREGVPHSLLEAAAMARPIIASDAVGCRDVVDDHVNGLLCRVRDAEDLAEKMVEMINDSPEHRSEMGRAGRRKVEAQFDEKAVIQKYLDMIDEVARVPQMPPVRKIERRSNRYSSRLRVQPAIANRCRRSGDRPSA
jgi:glycosyltransferase involved in cell wall biosynthesis